MEKSQVPTSQYQVFCDTYDMKGQVRIHKADGKQKLHISLKPEDGEENALSLFKEDAQMLADSILDTTNPDDIVIDWFLGSGTALIACEHTNRIGRFTEYEPHYVQGCILRYLSYCKRQNISVSFTHINGELTLDDFNNEQTDLQNTPGDA